MPPQRNACRFVDLKCNLSGVCLKFNGIGAVVRVGEKLGCGAYGDVFRACLINSALESTPTNSDVSYKRRNCSPVPRGPPRNLTTDFSNGDLRMSRAATLDADGQALYEDVQDTGNATETTSTHFAIKYFKDDTFQIMSEGLASGTIRELSIMKSCEGHPNIIKLVDVFVGPHDEIRERLNLQAQELQEQGCDNGSGNETFPLKKDQIFVLGLYEYCRGGDLGRAICRAYTKSCGGGFTLDQVKWYAFQLLNGIAYLH
ncbi:bifunctional Protein kinase domain/Protein kinase-like domain superfamily, partial [Babesia duncani]